MRLVEKILMEAAIPVETLFNGHDTNRYAFVFRDNTRYKTLEQKRVLVDKLENLRLKSGGNLPIAKLNPQMFVATQTSVDSDNLKKVASEIGEITELPFIVKLNWVYYLLDGHHRVSTALITKEQHVECRFLDLDTGNFF